jgi:hypothetical protein
MMLPGTSKNLLRVAFTNRCQPAFGSISTRRFFGAAESTTRSTGIEPALTLQAYRHLSDASTRAETRPIAAHPETNIAGK